MKRFSSRDVILYLMLLLLMIFAVNTVQQMDEADDPTYSQVRTLFEQEKVKYFVLNGNDLGRSLKPILDAMWDWGEGYKAQNS